MAWVTDTNFGSALFASDAFAPFAVGGGNKVIGFGAGVMYRDDIDVADLQLECDLVSRGAIVHGSLTSPVAYLVARRQADGSFYTAAYTHAKEGLEWGGAWEIRARLSLYRYDGPGDTFVFLGYTEILDTNPLAPTNSQLTKFVFRVNGNSLLTRLMDSSDQLIFENGVVDTVIPSSGNPGIAGNLITGGVVIRGTMFADNLQIGSI